MIVGNEILYADTELMQIADTLDLLRSFLACETAVSKSAARIPMIAMTTNSSTSVNAE